MFIGDYSNWRWSRICCSINTLKNSDKIAVLPNMVANLSKYLCIVYYTCKEKFVHITGLKTQAGIHCFCSFKEKSIHTQRFSSLQDLQGWSFCATSSFWRLAMSNWPCSIFFRWSSFSMQASYSFQTWACFGLFEQSFKQLISPQLRSLIRTFLSFLEAVIFMIKVMVK